MKLFLMPHEPSWWVWTVTAVLLAFGISGHPESFLVAIALSVMQTFFFLNRERAFRRLLRANPHGVRCTAPGPIRAGASVALLGADGGHARACALRLLSAFAVALAHALESTRANHFRPALLHSADAAGRAQLSPRPA